MPTIQFQLNGATVAVDADPDQTLLDVLRGRLGITSPHFGCGAGECGACHVMVGDRAMASCDMPMWSVADKEIVTLEGLGTAEQPHPLQRAFISEQAMQCGYCVSGILISAAALLKRNPSPIGSRGQSGARSQSVPLRIAQPHGPRRAAGSIGDGDVMSAPSPAPKLPVSLAANPRLSSWVKFTGEGRVAISPGKVEIGQGIVTALAQIAADELDVEIGRIEMIRASTAASPNEGVTSGSLSIQQSGRALRHVCAEVRQRFLAAASERLGVDASLLGVEDGMISGPGNVRTSYWELVG